MGLSKFTFQGGVLDIPQESLYLLYLVLSDEKGQTVIGDVTKPDIKGLLDLGIVEVKQLQHQPQFLVMATDPSMIFSSDEMVVYGICKMRSGEPFNAKSIIQWAKARGVERPLSCLRKLIVLSFVKREMAELYYFRTCR